MTFNDLRGHTSYCEELQLHNVSIIESFRFLTKQDI